MHRPFGNVRRPGAAIVTTAALSLFSTTVAQAQIPAPKLQAASPAGGKVGTTVDVTAVGADIEGLDSLWFDHAGIVAKPDKGGVFKVSIAPSVPPGRYEVRASSPWGISNPRVFMVGDRDEIAEAEPNNAASMATADRDRQDGQRPDRCDGCGLLQVRRQERPAPVDRSGDRLDRLPASTRTYG